MVDWDLMLRVPVVELGLCPKQIGVETCSKVESMAVIQMPSFLSAINSASTLGLFENGGEGSIGGGVEKSNSLLEKDGDKGGMLAGCTPPPVRLDLRPATNCWRDAGRAAGK
jgi:hypothetical protein